MTDLTSAVAIKVDEDLPAEVQQVFQTAGHDAVTVHMQGWSGIPDADLWAAIQEEGRMLVTADKGFSDERLFPPSTHAGIVIFRLTHESRRGYIQLTESLLNAYSIARLRGAIAVVSASGIRIRR